MDKTKNYKIFQSLREACASINKVECSQENSREVLKELRKTRQSLEIILKTIELSKYEK